MAAASGALFAQPDAPIRQVGEQVLFVDNADGTTTAVITHNAAIAAMADRVIHIGSGRIASIETNATKARPSDLSW